MYLQIRRLLAYYFDGIYDRSKEEDLPFLASGIAFNSLLWLIPYLLLLTSLFGVVLNSSDAAFRSINELLDSVFPPQSYALKIKE